MVIVAKISVRTWMMSITNYQEDGGDRPGVKRHCGRSYQAEVWKSPSKVSGRRRPLCQGGHDNNQSALGIYWILMLKWWLILYKAFLLSEACFDQGEFDVIKGLLENYPIMVEAKRKIDRVGFPTTSLNLSNLTTTTMKGCEYEIFKVIDICGPTPKGTGLQNMREAIIESKWKYDVSTEDKQVCVLSLSEN